MDPLLQLVQQRHPEPWGRVLDAGTGDSSLSWLCQLPCEAWTAVCAEPARAAGLSQRYGARFRPQDQLLVGLWQDPDFLADQRFDVVVADYVLGACERYAPGFQESLLERLCGCSRSWLYVTGLEPYALQAEHWLSRMAALRDAVLLLRGSRPHRELPQVWVESRLLKLGWTLIWRETFCNLYDEDFVQRELGAIEANLGELGDPGLAQVLRRRCMALRREALERLHQGDSLGSSQDYAIAALAPGVSLPETNK